VRTIVHAYMFGCEITGVCPQLVSSTYEGAESNYYDALALVEYWY